MTEVTCAEEHKGKCLGMGKLEGRCCRQSRKRVWRLKNAFNVTLPLPTLNFIAYHPCQCQQLAAIDDVETAEAAKLDAVPSLVQLQS